MLCRLITNSQEGCQECADDEAAGWVDVNDMKEIGTRECGDFCKCDIEFEDEFNLTDEDITVTVEVDTGDAVSGSVSASDINFDADYVNMHPEMLGHMKPTFLTDIFEDAYLDAGLNVHQGNVISNYTDRGYRFANDFTSKGLGDPKWIREIKEKAAEVVETYRRNLEASLDLLPGYKGHVYRGEDDLGGKTLAFMKQMVGKTYKTDIFVSTSASSSGAFSGQINYVIEAIGKRGKDIEKFSFHPHETEVLFNRGTSFKVLKVEGSTVHLQDVP